MQRFGGWNSGVTVLASVTVWLAVSPNSAAWLAADCNDNGVDDAADILGGNSDDCNSNGVPDECDVFPLSFLIEPSLQLGVGFSPVGLTLADFDGSGMPDLAVSSAPILDGCVSVFLQTASGVFTTSVCSPLQIDKSPNAVAAADLDGDGDIDLAVAYNGGFLEIGGVDILLNDLPGGCLLAASWSPFIGPFRPVSMAAADFDGDGDVDLAVAGSEDVSVLLNDSSGAFTLAAGSPFLSGTDPSQIVAGDFNGDGHVDVAITDHSADEVVVALNDGTGDFPTAAHVAVLSEPRALATADLDDDGDLDLAVANTGSDSLSILVNTGGSFSLHTTLPAVRAPGGVVATDFDGDGNMDLAVSNTAGNAVTVRLGPSFTARRSFPTGAGPGPLVATDLDVDGDVDLVVLNTGSNTASILLASGPVAADANRDGVPDDCRTGGYGSGVLPFLSFALAIWCGLRWPFGRHSAASTWAS